MKHISVKTQNELKKWKQKRTSKRRNSVFINLLLISLFVNGILLHRNKYLRFIFGMTYHVAWGLSLTKTMTCIITNTYLVDLYSGYLVVHIVAITLWWTLYLKRNLTYACISRLSWKYGDFKIATKIFIVVLALILFPPFFLYADLTNRAVTEDSIGPRPCRYFKSVSNDYTKSAFLIIEATRPYISYSIFFAAFLSFFLSGLLTIKCLNHIAERIYLEDSVFVWNKLKYTIIIVKEMENIVSLPVFLVLCKIAVDIFNGVSAICSGHRAKYSQFVFLMAVPQELIWLLLIVVLGDSIQKQSLKIINSSFSHLRYSKTVHVCLSYIDYKNMKSATVLTAGNVFKINRSLLLKALTSAISYGVIISQYKDMN